VKFVWAGLRVGLQITQIISGGEGPECTEA